MGWFWSWGSMDRIWADIAFDTGCPNVGPVRGSAIYPITLNQIRTIAEEDM